MLRLLLVMSWIVAASFASSERITSTERAKGCFGVRVSLGSNGNICTYACWLDNGRTLTNKRIVDRESFIKIVSGEWPSVYNPDRINYFEENGIDGGIRFDSSRWKEVTYCEPLDSLWKIRFATYPFQHNTEMGWSNKYHKPSPKQELYIYERYDVENVDLNFFLDTNFWRLLKDVSDTNWIKDYRSRL